jgi:hypothetical protein
MTSTTDRRVQSQKFGKHRVGVLGAAVVAASVVAFGSAGIAHAYTIVNNTGYDLNDGFRNGASLSYPDPAPPIGEAPGSPGSGSAHFSMSANDQHPAAQWSLYWELDQWASRTSHGDAEGAGSFLYQEDAVMYTPTPWTEYLTLGGKSTSFYNENIVTCANCPGPESVSFVRTNFAWGPPIRTRGAVIVVNEKPVKIWGPRSSTVRGVVPKGPAPQAPVAAVSPVSSTLSAQQQSVAKTATPHRAAARRAAVTASRSAPPA